MMTASGMRYVMGTFLNLTVQASKLNIAAQACDSIFSDIQRLETLLSIYLPNSEVAQINRAAGISPVKVSPETYNVIDRALYFARLSLGAFDPTLDGRFQDVILNADKHSIFLLESTIRLDLGGIGKGFAMDQALDRACGRFPLTRVYMNFGGQLLFWSSDDCFEPETVGIEDPVNRDNVLTTFRISSNCSISTSSNIERPGHLIDPRDRRLAQDVMSATVIAPNATVAEAWSTALFICGAKEGKRLLKNQSGVRFFIQL